ncbi:MAG: COG1615 family transporter, partial [Gammaproteobacteria bacterium]|nr:COG1615 family transporter [Gammaproteobacteria bacterium]
MKLLFKLIVVLLIVGIFAYFTAEFLMELWWFRSLDLGGFFVLRETYDWLVKIGTTILLTCLVYLNFSYIPRALSLHQDADNKGLLAFLQNHKKVLWLLSLLIVIPLLIPVYANWESFLLFYFGAQSELVDPAYGENISYYFFSYPVYVLIQEELLWVFSLLLAVVSFLYFVFYKKHKDKLQEFPAAARLHIAKLVAILIILQAWSIALERIEMLYEDRHLPVFYGPGFVEMNYHLPLIILSFLLFLGTAICTVYSLYSGKKYKLALVLGLSYLLVMAIKQVDVVPNWIDDYYVTPHPVQAEAKYIKYNIKATSDAFNFSDITQIDYTLESSLTPFAGREISKELDDIPIWDDNLILPVFEQLQSIRPYFSFYEVAVDRYELGSRNVQVNIAARELDYQSLAPEAKKWRNRHLVYTHGYGMVMSSANQRANRPMQWLLQNFGQTVEFDKLKLTQPEIYYGLADYQYAIVPNSEALRSENSVLGDMRSDYQGSGGIHLASLFTKAIASTFFKDERIFFSAGINNKSRILVRRNINERVKAIAPFLELDPDPFPVLVNHKIYWIVDAYTYSNRYPLVEPIKLSKNGKQKKFNYARNSVKIIIDAYNGSVDFYVVDEEDPIIRTYRRIYPSLFKDLATMPKPFIKHLSYPKA